MTQNELNAADIKSIVNNLITFIVLEGKEYVSEEKKSEYAASYVHLLIKTINQIEDTKKYPLVENIAKDISLHIK